MTSNTSRPVFGGHEKFTLRNGWLEKGTTGILENPLLFQQQDALVQLGVGKNMVRSIRHWCLASLLLEPNDLSPHALQLTHLARGLFIEKWDPYIEDIATLWLIHVNFANNFVRCKVWQWALSFAGTEFSKPDMLHYMHQQSMIEGIKVSEKALDAELDCLVRTYTSTKPKYTRHYEESYDSPFIELDLMRGISDDARIFLFNVGPKPTLPPEIVCYSLILFISQHGRNRRTLSIDECRLGIDSPGLIFKLDENSLMDYMDQFPKMTDGIIELQESGGVNQLTWDQSRFDDGQLARRVLEAYYAK